MLLSTGERKARQAADFTGLNVISCRGRLKREQTQSENVQLRLGYFLVFLFRENPMFAEKSRPTGWGMLLRASAVAGALAFSASVAMAQGAAGGGASGGGGGAGGGGSGGAEQTPAGSPGAKKGTMSSGESGMTRPMAKKKKKKSM